MLRNYIMAALRNMRRYKTFTLINVAGLALGLSICMIIIMSVAYQMKSDRYNPESENIYRLVSARKSSSAFGLMATVQLPLAPVLEEHSGVEKAVRIRRGFGRHWIGMPDEMHIPIGGFFADPEFISLFHYPMAQGDAATALSEPFSVVLTRQSAIKLFGDDDPMGKVIDMDELGEYTVTGVVDMNGIATHIEFEAIASMSSAEALEKSEELPELFDSWDNYTGGWVYFQTRDDANLDDITSHVRTVLDNNLEEDYGMVVESQSLTSIKPGPLTGNEIGPFMPWFVVYILGGLGLIIMFSSCFNYVNLSVARSMSRAREVGIRKVNGAGRGQVVLQFIVESVLLSLIALLLAIVLLIYFEPAFEQLNFARILRWQLSHEPMVWGVILLFTLITGVLAGLFPSLVMSRFQPLQVIKGMKSLKIFSHVGMRKLLIVVQFTLSLFFVISILIFYNQVKMMTTSPAGFNAGQIITAPFDEDNYDVLRNRLKAQSWVENVTRSSHLPATGTVMGDGLGRTMEETEDGVSYFAVDEHYLENMSIPLVAGRNLNARPDGQDESDVLINEKAVTHFGFETPADAIGELLYTRDSSEVTIVGVIPDYHHEAMMAQIEPLALRILPDRYNYVQVRVVPDRLEEAQEQMVALWKEFRPEQVAAIRTMQASMDEFYDLIFGDLISILILFAFLATFISCLGLLGIAIYTTELRMKEVSIRKVLGADSGNLVYILSWGFLKLILIATVIAIPLSYFANRFWLNMMATRIEMSPWFYIAGTLLLISVALLTIGSQTLRSLRINPADLLRNE